MLSAPEVAVLLRDLDRGEAETLAFAVELGAELVLMDERDGRRFAQRLGLRPAGVVGILLEAKKGGWLNRIRPCLDALRHDAGFYVSDGLYESAFVQNCKALTVMSDSAALAGKSTYRWLNHS